MGPKKRIETVDVFGLFPSSIPEVKTPDYPITKKKKETTIVLETDIKKKDRIEKDDLI